MAKGSAAAPDAGDWRVDGLLSGYRWDSDVLSFGFGPSAADYGTDYGAEPGTDFSPVTFAMQQAFRFIIEGASTFAGGPKMAVLPLTGFTRLQVGEAGASRSSAPSSWPDIAIGSTGATTTAHAYYPSPDSSAAIGDIWFGPHRDFRNPLVGSYGFESAIHELGHALGLKHPHDIGDEDALPTLPASMDSVEYTVMSYRSYPGAITSGYTNERFGLPQTFMVGDIAALQILYGANFDFRSADTVYRFDRNTGETFVDGVGQGVPGVGGDESNRIFETIWDGGGIDTYDLSTYRADLSIDLAPGSSSAFGEEQLALLGGGVLARGNVYNALQYEGDPRSLIENAKGGRGNDTLHGNAAANHLYGNGGRDTLSGGAGSDTMEGGAGNDTYLVDDAFDLVIDPSGTDRVVTTVDYTLGRSIEQLTGSGPHGLALTGNNGANTIAGGAGDDVLTGAKGKDAFLFSAKLDRAMGSVDTIVDFNARDDSIHLAKSVFAKVAKKGVLAHDAFWTGSKAHDASDRLIYNRKTGDLSYDLDGSGKGAAILFATLIHKVKLTEKDFFLV